MSLNSRSQPEHPRVTIETDFGVHKQETLVAFLMQETVRNLLFLPLHDRSSRLIRKALAFVLIAGLETRALRDQQGD